MKRHGADVNLFGSIILSSLGRADQRWLDLTRGMLGVDSITVITGPRSGAGHLFALLRNFEVDRAV